MYHDLVRSFHCSDCNLTAVRTLHDESADCLSCGKLLYSYDVQTLVSIYNQGSEKPCPKIQNS